MLSYKQGLGQDFEAHKKFSLAFVAKWSKKTLFKRLSNQNGLEKLSHSRNYIEILDYYQYQQLS